MSTTWTGIAWRKLKAGDPLATVRSVVPWRGGFVALGAEVRTDDTWRTPAWTSADGISWTPVAVGAFGSTTVVLGIGATAGGLAAMTLQSGTNQCGGDPPAFDCWTLAGPLQSWTSPDGATWTAHPGPPEMGLPQVGCDSCGVDRPTFSAGAPGLLAFKGAAVSTTFSGLAFSKDGVTWQAEPVGAFPDHFQAADIEPIGTGFIAVGDNGGDPSRAAALISSDGRHWAAHDLATSGDDSGTGTVAFRIFVGPSGVIAEGGDAGTGGTAKWWRSVSGRTWRRVATFTPLGVAAGSDLCEAGCAGGPNGTLLADGERMLALRSCTKAVGWTSLDGRTWRSVTFSGTRPTRAGTPILLPIGLVCAADDGSAWFGRPVAG